MEIIIKSRFTSGGVIEYLNDAKQVATITPAAAGYSVVVLGRSSVHVSDQTNARLFVETELNAAAGALGLGVVLESCESFFTFEGKTYYLHHVASRRGYCNKANKGKFEPYNGTFGRGFIQRLGRRGTSSSIETIAYWIA